MRVTIDPCGLNLTPGGSPTILPLLAGSLHYWRHSPERWGDLLDALVAMGLTIVDTYVPWGLHETDDGDFDFGERRPERAVRAFVKLAAEKGLKVILRPGPHINAELTYFGLPKRIVWNEEVQARSPRGNPVVLPILPLAFPVPSYASETFHREVAVWYRAVGHELADLRHPEGPIVLVQVDNEGSMYFRDAPYDQDYHPDALRLFRSFLRAKYGVQQALRDAWGDPTVSFADVAPPVAFDVATPRALVRHLDWMEYHEQHLAWGIQRMARELREAGFSDIPTIHNFPPGEAATALNPARLGVDMIGLDYYHPASVLEHMAVFRRTTELVTRAQGNNAPPFASEMGVGGPPYFPPLDLDDSLFTLMTALAYGLRGFNLYMAVDRDRWIGGLISPDGVPRPGEARYRALLAALREVDFVSLRRHAPVRLVIPRALRRHARAAHAFGPLSPALFHILGAGFEQSCFEDDFGLGVSAPMAAERFLRSFERALTARGVPFAYAGGESFLDSTQDAAWVVCATSGLLKKELVTHLREVRRGGARVTLGPTVPRVDVEVFASEEELRGLELEPLDNFARADELVAQRIEELGLPAYPVEPEAVVAAVHQDAQGVARLLFLMNPTTEAVEATVALPKIERLRDLLSGDEIARAHGGFSARVPPRTVRMFAV